MHPAPRTSGGDSLSEARWYRVTGLAGSRLLSEPPNPDVSGTFACAYHDGWLRTQHPQPKAPLVDAVVCFTVLPCPRTPPQLAHPTWDLAPAPHSCTPSMHLTCTSPASIPRTSPALHSSSPAPLSCLSPPGCAADGRLSKHAHPRQGGNRLVRPPGRGSTSSFERTGASYNARANHGT